MADSESLAAAAPYVPFDPFADPDGFPLCCLSRRTVVYSCGAIAHHGDELKHEHPPGERSLARRLATRAAKLMDGVDIGMGSEGTPIRGTDSLQPFFVTASVGTKVTKALTERQVRSAFGGVISPKCSVCVEPLQPRGEWWESVVQWYSESEEAAEELPRWQRMIRWFNSRQEFRSTAFVRIGDGPQDGGATFPRLFVGVTEAGSLAGLIGCVVHT
jgi:hypothetical protein